ncbi:MAG: hypothetical protein FWF49_01075 [Oscillospiraceae bacterium]|nr:hypothetical protein [Oscillospiraceae bacterium]
MRVFRQYAFDLKDRVLFKDTLPFVEKWLEENGIAHENMAFMLQHGDADKVVSRYPALQKYKMIDTASINVEKITPRGILSKSGELHPLRYQLSSVPPEWPDNADIHVAKEDELIVREVAAKIPRPFNFGFVQILLDNIHWFPEINPFPATRGKYPPNAICSDVHQSNRIELIKQFDYGKKHNLVLVRIEVTKSDDELLDVQPIVTKLSETFGKIIEKEMIVVFDEEEILNSSENNEEFVALLQNLCKELKLGVRYEQYPIESFVSTGGTSPKKIMINKMKGTGYRYISYGYSRYTFHRVNENHHLFELTFDFPPSIACLRCGLSIRGYNFSVPYISFDSCARKTDLEGRTEEVVTMALEIEERLEGTLERLYGKSPEWMEY